MRSPFVASWAAALLASACAASSGNPPENDAAAEDSGAELPDDLPSLLTEPFAQEIWNLSQPTGALELGAGSASDAVAIFVAFSLDPAESPSTGAAGTWSRAVEPDGAPVDVDVGAGVTTCLCDDNCDRMRIDATWEATSGQVTLDVHADGTAALTLEDVAFRGEEPISLTLAIPSFFVCEADENG
jgi:hypothetical protein